MPNSEQKTAELRRAALDYHEFPTPGKVAIAATKQLVNQHDLALAYSPGVAAPCEEIVADPANAFRYTSRGNLVAVITNGTAVLGLGNIGPLAAKPVMEGKGVLFKKFAGIDVFDIEIAENNLEKLVDVLGVDLEVDAVDVGEALEQDGFALHHRLAGQRADVAQPEHRGAVGDDRHQVAARGVIVGGVGILGDLDAGRRHAR